MLLIGYDKCTTCKKAYNYLIKNNMKVEYRNIKENNPTFKELRSWVQAYNIEIKKLFNTSGIIYREMNLKDKVGKMSDKEKLELLSSSGMLVKRPILITDNDFLIGFNEKKWDEMLRREHE